MPPPTIKFGEETKHDANWQPPTTIPFGQEGGMSEPTQTMPAPTPQKGFLQKAGDVVNSIFPGKQIGQAIGTLGGYGITAAKEKLGLAPKGTTSNYDTSAPSPLQVASDAANAALFVDSMTPVGGLTKGGVAEKLLGKSKNIVQATTPVGKIAGNAALGASLGGTNAIAQGESAGDVGKSALVGGGIGAAGSGAIEGLAHLKNNLPAWLVKAALPKLDQSNIPYALEHTKIGGIKSMAAKSNESIGHYESQIQKILSHPNYSGVGEDSNKILQKAVSLFPNSEYTAKDIISNAKNLSPTVSKLITKMEAGQANLQELNTIRKGLDQATKSVYTSLNRPPESKMLGAAFANAIREHVQTSAPETANIFSNYAKEIGLMKALEAAGKKGNGIGLKDLVFAGAGLAHGGLLGGFQDLALERLGTSKAVQMGGAKAIKATGNVIGPVVKGAFQTGKAEIIKKTTDQNQNP